MEYVFMSIASTLFGFLGGFLYNRYDEHQEKKIWDKFIKDIETEDFDKRIIPGSPTPEDKVI